MPLRRPSAATIYALEARPVKKFRMMLRYWLRFIPMRAAINALIAYLNDHAVWQPVFTQNWQRLNALLFRHGDKRFGLQKRLSTITQTFDQVALHLGPQRTQTLVTQGRLPLAQLGDELTLWLMVNPIDALEGLFSLSLRNTHDDSRCYDASFLFIDPQTLLIASIQGPKGEEAQQRVKDVTKKLHGERPMFAMMEMLRALAHVWQVTLVGVKHTSQVKLRLHGSKKVYFNYDDFWQECGGVACEAGWRLPLTKERKSMEDIASKKRAQYRRRFDMLDAAQASIEAALH